MLKQTLKKSLLLSSVLDCSLARQVSQQSIYNKLMLEAVDRVMVFTGYDGEIRISKVLVLPYPHAHKIKFLIHAEDIISALHEIDSEEVTLYYTFGYLRINDTEIPVYPAAGYVIGDRPPEINPEIRKHNKILKTDFDMNLTDLNFEINKKEDN